MMDPLKNEDDKELQSMSYSAHLHQIKTEDNTEATTFEPAKHIKSETVTQSGWRTVDDGQESITSLPIMMVTLKSEDDDDEKEHKSLSYSSHINEIKTENNTEVEDTTFEPMKWIKSETVTQSGLRTVDDGQESITSLPIMMVTLKSEDDDDEKEHKSLSYSSHINEIKTENNTEVEDTIFEPMKWIKSKTDGEDCGGPELTSNPDPNSHLQPDIDRNASGSSDKHLSHFGPKMEDGDEGWNDNKPHGSDVNRHVGCYTAKKNLSCPQCGKKFDSQQSLQRHLTKKSLSCLNRNESLRVTKDVNIQVHTGNKTLPCDVCGKILSHKSSFRKHMRLHTAEKLFSCDECGEKFSQMSDLNQHLRIHSKHKPFCCDECGQTFRVKFSLNRHKKIHSGHKPFSCDECGQRFSVKFNLNQHMGIHRGDRPFSCDECGQTFGRMSDLNQHTRIHTGDKPFSCNECGHSFNRMSDLNQHTRIHTGDKPFSCNECGHRFRQKGHLNLHMRIHTGDKPFSCDRCGQRFSDKSSLNRHKRIHTGDKPFSCDECGQKFRQKGHLNRHIKTHTGDNPFSYDEYHIHQADLDMYVSIQE